MKLLRKVLLEGRVYPLTLPMIAERVAKTDRDIERAKIAEKEGRRRGNADLQAYGAGRLNRIESGRSAAKNLARGLRRGALRDVATGARGTSDTQRLTGPQREIRGVRPISNDPEDRTPEQNRVDRSFRTLGRQLTKLRRDQGQPPAPGPKLP